MSNGVAEVEKVAETAFTLVIRYDIGFNTYGAKDDPLEDILNSFKSRAAWAVSDICSCNKMKISTNHFQTVYL